MAKNISTTPAFELLAAELLDHIDKDDDQYLLSQEYWNSRVLKHQPMTKADDAALILCRRNRARYDRAVHSARKSFLAVAFNTNNPKVLAAASAGSRHEIRFDDTAMRHFSLTLRPSGVQDWLIFFNLKSSLFPLGSVIELRDSSGRTWLKGTPDDSGQMVGQLQGVEDARQAARSGLRFFLDGIPLTNGEVD